MICNWWICSRRTSSTLYLLRSRIGYTILKGTGIMEVEGDKQAVKEGDCIFIPGGLNHSLYNTGEDELHMMFVYAPGIIVDHWAKEQSGELK